MITVPAYFDDAQRQATKDAATLAGLPVLRLLSEPTAAALAYGLDQGAAGVHAVYDLGGGTFDISILRLTGGVFEGPGDGGDSALGGDDLDRAVANWALAQAGIGDDAVLGPDPAPDDRPDTRLDQRTLRRLLRAAAAAKERLSTAPSADLRLDLPDGRHWSGTLDRATFEALVEPLIARSLAACRRALRDARVTAAQVDAVVLVGGSMRVPLVRARVAALFGREPLSDAQIESMLRDSRSHAQEDQMARRLREERVAGERVVESLCAALARDGDELLAADERARVDAALAQLQATLGRPDAFVIRQAVRALERTCAFDVERRMNRSIQGAMAGCRLAEFAPEAKEI